MLKLLAVAVTLLGFSAGAFDQPAPFGFSWGPVDKVPTPSLAGREDNVTFLMYGRDRLPPDELRDTEEIVLEICKNEGLQQIVWFSRLLSASEEQDKIASILTEGSRRYGRPEQEDRGIIRWSAGRTVVARIAQDQDHHRIIMVSTGPGLDSCSEEHKSITGHPLREHWMRWLSRGDAK